MMADKSSKVQISHVLKLLFEKYKRIYFFYTGLIVTLIFVSLLVFFDSRLSSLFELSDKNPFGILSSIFMQNSFYSLVFNIFSVFLLIFSFTCSNSILENYGFSLKYDLSKFFIFVPIASSIIGNIITYALIISYNLSGIALAGFHVIVQSLLGFTILIILYMSFTFKSYGKFFFPLSLIILGFLGLYLFYGISFFGLRSFIFDFQKFLSLFLGMLSSIVIAKLKFG